MVNGADVSFLPTDQLNAGFRFARAVSRKPRDFLSSRRGRLLLEILFQSLPFGALVVDARQRLFFANSEALHVLSLWRSEGPRAGPKKHRFEAFLPPDIAAACDRLQHEFMKRTRADKRLRPNFAARLRVQHNDRPKLSAVVSLERSRRDRAVAGFCILLQDGLTCNIAAGRGDQLALLTAAERHVAKTVASGLTNEEVADALGKSLGTVKAQLRSIFAKLGVRTRTQLVSALRSMG